MRFLQDVARRLSIGAMLAAVALAAWNGPAALAQTTAGQAQPAQAPATQRLPQPGRAAAGSRPPAQVAAQPGATSRVPIGGGQIAPAPSAPRGASPPPPAPTAPFQISAHEQELLDKTLARWEEQNSKTKTFKCKFKRWEYDNELTDDQAKDHCRSVGAGEVKYKQPDHGMFRITELLEFNGNEHKYEKRVATDGLDHWVCDGTAIYEFVPADKKLKVHPLPKEMQGEAIADGPIPFIFGAKVDKMKQRYWIHDITPKEEIGQHVWLEVFPKYQHDAVNFSSAILVLNAPDFSLYGLQITQVGGKQRSAFTFSDIVINDKLAFLKGDFAEPRTPPGWTKEVDAPPSEPEQPEAKPVAAAAPATIRQPKATATAPAASTKR